MEGTIAVVEFQKHYKTLFFSLALQLLPTAALTSFRAALNPHHAQSGPAGNTLQMERTRDIVDFKR